MRVGLVAATVEVVVLFLVRKGAGRAAAAVGNEVWAEMEDR